MRQKYAPADFVCSLLCYYDHVIFYRYNLDKMEKMEKCVFNDRLSFFISSFTPDNSALCERVGAEARKRGVPVIRREAEGFLRMLLALKNPRSILEVGTAVGYSTLIMAENTQDDCMITTIEIGEEDARRAEENFREAGLLGAFEQAQNRRPGGSEKKELPSPYDSENGNSDRLTGECKRIHLIRADAASVLPGLEGSFDLVFLDASKGQYLKFFNGIRRLLSPGAVVISDNVLQGGDVLKSRFIIEQRDRTVHRRMRDFLFAITHDEEFTTSIVPVGDGMAVSVFKQDPFDK